MAEFDGIQEKEEGKKKMPLGMIILFLGLVVFGAAYLYLFMPQTTGWTQQKKYEEQVRAHEAERMKYMKEHEAVETPEHEAREAEMTGEGLYKEHCALCHGEKLEGGVGPALTGPKFIYGGRLEDHVRIIGQGTQKGMPPFDRQFGAEKVRAVAQYIHTRHKH